MVLELVATDYECKGVITKKDYQHGKDYTFHVDYDYKVFKVYEYEGNTLTKKYTIEHDIINFSRLIEHFLTWVNGVYDVESNDKSDIELFMHFLTNIRIH